MTRDTSCAQTGVDRCAHEVRGVSASPAAGHHREGIAAARTNHTGITRLKRFTRTAGCRGTVRRRPLRGLRALRPLPRAPVVASELCCYFKSRARLRRAPPASMTFYRAAGHAVQDRNKFLGSSLKPIRRANCYEHWF